MKKLFTLAILSFLFFSTNIGYAQLQEGLSFSHSYFPTNKTIGIQKSKIEYLRWFGLDGQGTALLVGADYTFSSFDFYKEKYPSVSTSKLEDFHTLSISAGYQTPIGNDWLFLGLIMPYFSSNLDSDGDLDKRDFGMDGAIAFTKMYTTSYLTLGLAYSTQSGLPLPIPIISWHKTINETWDYTLGIPQFDLNFHATPRSSFKSFVKMDGVTGNIRKSVLADNPGIKSRFGQFSIIGGLGYDFKINKSISLSLEGGYTFWHFLYIQNYEIKMPPDELYDFDSRNTLYLNAGLRIGI